MPWASASDHTVLNGSTGDECRAPRIQSGNGATGKLLLRDKQYPSVSAEAAPAVDRNNSALGGGSVQAVPGKDRSHWSWRLKKTWKGTLEQQDGHNDKADTHQEQKPYRNTP